MAAAGGSLDKLRGLWKQAPAVLREKDEEFLIAYATSLCDYGAIDDAEALLREAIARRWSVKLVVGYGMLERGNAAAPDQGPGGKHLLPLPQRHDGGRHPEREPEDLAAPRGDHAKHSP